ncbi:hypothetical protein [Sodalis sp. (in: enterobacteria)]
MPALKWPPMTMTFALPGARAGVQAARQGYRGELQFPPAGRHLYR